MNMRTFNTNSNSIKILLILFVVILSSCSNSNKKFVGRWKVTSEQRPGDAEPSVYNSEDFFRFRKDVFLRSNSDTHFSDYWGSDACKYDVDDKTISIYYSKTSDNIDKIFSYSFTSDTNLILVYVKPEAVAGTSVNLSRISNDPN